MVKDYKVKDHLISNEFLFEGYRRFIESCSKTQTLKDAITALLDELEKWVVGEFSCCHLSDTYGSELLDIYSSSAKRSRIKTSVTDLSKVPIREDHLLHRMNETRPLYFAGPMIVSCTRGGEERRFQVNGLLSVPVIRSEKVAAVISIGNVGPIEMDMVDKLSLAVDVCWSVIETIRSEEAMRESEARLKQAQRLGRIGNWVWDLERNSLYWSDELYRIYGVDPDTFLLTYENILSRLHPDDRDGTARTVEIILEDKMDTSFDFRIIRSDTTIRSIHQVIEVELTDKGNIKRLIGTMQDITDISNLNRTVEESRDRLKVVFDQTPVMICLLDGDRKITFCNKAFEEVSGWPDTEFGSPFACGALGCVNSLDDPRGCGYGPKCRSCSLYNAIEDTWRSGRSQRDVEYSTIQSKNGKRREVVLLGSTTKVRIGGTDHTLLSLLDITSLKNAERALLYSRERYKELYQRSIDPIFTLDRTQRILDMNIASIKLLSSPTDHAIGKRMQDILGFEPGLTRYLDGMGDGRVSDQIPFSEVNLVREGRTFHFELSHLRIKDETGEELVQLIFHDITQRRQMEDRMKRSLLTYDVRDGAVHLVSEIPDIAIIGLLKELQGIGYNIHLAIRPSAEERLLRTIAPTSVLILDRGLLTIKEQKYSKMLFDLTADLKRGDILYLEEIEYIVLNDGFPEVLKLVQDLRDMAMLRGFIVLMTMDIEVLNPQQLKALRKECRPLLRRALQSLPTELKRLLDLILEANINGEYPDHTALASLSGKSKPTVRKQVRALSEMGLVREYKHGRRKLIELLTNDVS